MAEFFAPSNSTAVDPELGPIGTSLYSEKRPRRDFAFTVVYCVLAAFTLFGSFAIFGNSGDVNKYPASFLANSTTCDIDSYNNAESGRSLLDGEYGVSEADVENVMSKFATGLSIWLPLSAICGIAFAVGYILLFKKHAIKMVWTSIYAQVGLCLAVGILNLILGNIVTGVILVVIAVVMSVVYWWMRDQLHLCAKLLTVSGKGLEENPHLASASVVLKLTGISMMIYMFVAIFSGFLVGSAGPNANVFHRIGTDANGACYDQFNTRVGCCQFQVAGWANFYIIFAIFTLLWTVQLVMEIRLFMVADVIASWYFCPEGTSPGSAQSPSVIRAARHALGPSFGSIAFASLIITIIEMIRSILRQQARKNIFCCIINCIAQPLLAFCEQLTKFATIACAITGLPFIEAAKKIFGTLKRNFMQTYSVWWIPSFVLKMSALLGSIIWAAIVYFATYLQFKSDPDVVSIAIFVSLVCFCLVFFILGFVALLLLDIVDSVYICFAMDRDTQCVTKPEIHAIYSSLPTMQGALVQNPDGGLAYGASEVNQPPAPVMVQMAPAGYTQPGYPQQQGGAQYAPVYTAPTPYQTQQQYPPQQYPPQYPGFQAPSQFPGK